jgi:hypothetical protein
VTSGGPERHPPGRGAPGAPVRRAYRPRTDDSAPSRAAPLELLFFLLVAAVVVAGWRVRHEEYLTAESGVGYALGILGTVLMLLLVLYPLRKRMRVMRNWGAIKHWFRAHMILGVVGPAMILFHANFWAGSLNSAVAVVSMLLVVTSGFVGRYLYGKIHYGLYGRQMTLTDLKEKIEHELNDSARLLAYAPELQRRLLAFDAAMLTPCPNLLQGFWRVLTTGLRTRWTGFRLRRGLERALRVAARTEGWSAAERGQRRRRARGHISAHMMAARRVARFSLYERLFALWHLWHTPLFVMLLITVAVHIIAVHLY